MRIDIGHKLGAVILLLALLAAGLSAFALIEANREQGRFDQMETIANLGVQAHTLVELVQRVVIDADVVTLATDKQEAQAKLVALKDSLRELDTAEQPFFTAIGTRLPLDRQTALKLRLSEFEAYQTDTATLGLTVSPQAAQIQASDPATVANREKMVRDFNTISRSLFDMAAVERVAVLDLRRQAKFLLIAVPCITILFGFLASVWLVRSQIQTPLVRLRRSMHALAKGALDVAIPYVRKQDEIGDMANSIEVFQRALVSNRQADELMRTRALDDVQRADTIVQSTQRFESIAVGLMEELSSSVTAMDAAASAVAAASGHTQDEASIVWRAAEGATKILVSVSQAADELSRSASVISDNMRTTKDVASTALEEATTTKAKVATLVEAAQKIGGAASLIDEIARQTNLLALNATIEAARAGDAGRGFAVVAGEVKFLAKRTAEATAIIAEHIQMIQDITTRTAQGITMIKDTLDRMNAISADVANAMLEQGHSSEQIAIALAEATDQARIVSKSIGEVQGAAIANGERALELKTKAIGHSQQATTLSGFITNFVGDMRRVA
ncbi:methyl-accepting chemotaxis protein [Beijerinckia sp. L45]|uniref:methyl-accepting chemotaxis protein n=1 Tax=Beijerinckia sp. L45 TaxID=1641855 RepID=UPI00131BAD45|nr:methyl-accepting chemotaxis protein [Beijerinckia sp. L45]